VEGAGDGGDGRALGELFGNPGSLIWIEAGGAARILPSAFARLSPA
jgi:hypothetical protein